MGQTVSWSTAASVAKRVARRFPSISSSERMEIEEDFSVLVPQAEEMVTRLTGLSVPHPSRAEVVDRAGWVDANLVGYRKMMELVPSSLLGGSGLPGVDVVLGLQVGAFVGYISSRVLGQYDLLLGSEVEAGGAIYFVGPNIVQLERRFGFPKKQFRLWVALHEMTHRYQFESIEWLRPTFTELVSQMLSVESPSVSDLIGAAIRIYDSIRAGQNPLAENGLAGLVVSKSQGEALRKITALMSIAEGHGDWVMNRAAGHEIPEAYRFHSVLSERRTTQTGAAKIISQLLGLEAKMRQYEVGERFIETIEERSPGSIETLFLSAGNLPTIEELRDPTIWLSRVGLVKLR